MPSLRFGGKNRRFTNKLRVGNVEEIQLTNVMVRNTFELIEKQTYV